MGSIWKTLGAVAVLGMAGQAYADEDVGKFDVGPSIGTLGIGLEGGYRATDYLGVRAGFNMFSLNVKTNSSGINYSTDINLATVGSTVDLYPFAHASNGSGFRVSAGLKWDGNEAKVNATPANTVVVGNTAYAPAAIGTINGKLTFNPVAPYLGVGYSGRIFDSVYLAFDAGAIYQGSAKVSLSSTSGLISQADLDAEKSKIKSKLDLLQFYPVAMVSAKYRF